MVARGGGRSPVGRREAARAQSRHSAAAASNTGRGYPRPQPRRKAAMARSHEDSLRRGASSEARREEKSGCQEPLHYHAVTPCCVPTRIGEAFGANLIAVF